MFSFVNDAIRSLADVFDKTSTSMFWTMFEKTQNIMLTMHISDVFQTQNIEQAMHLTMLIAHP